MHTNIKTCGAEDMATLWAVILNGIGFCPVTVKYHQSDAHFPARQALTMIYNQQRVPLAAINCEPIICESIARRSAVCDRRLRDKIPPPKERRNI